MYQKKIIEEKLRKELKNKKALESDIGASPLEQKH